MLHLPVRQGVPGLRASNWESTATDGWSLDRWHQKTIGACRSDKFLLQKCHLKVAQSSRLAYSSQFELTRQHQDIGLRASSRGKPVTSFATPRCVSVVSLRLLLQPLTIACTPSSQYTHEAVCSSACILYRVSQKKVSLFIGAITLSILTTNFHNFWHITKLATEGVTYADHLTRFM